ncbi:hypothetical protein HDF16_004609 [Granulicella aggregans]|uniref:Uncharacterized protein n=1 Tax=Granulicella aggregans TaxID=474949 RepID=A0A7W7ZH89_9BACT|nr:hypothetical protein [Granulicella aggregans]MBB5059880.1 hypothetical protein [Granulicella aggregans]
MKCLRGFSNLLLVLLVISVSAAGVEGKDSREQNLAGSPIDGMSGQSRATNTAEPQSPKAGGLVSDKSRPTTNLMGNQPAIWLASHDQAAGSFTGKETLEIPSGTRSISLCFTGARGGSGVETAMGNDLILQAAIAFRRGSEKAMQFAVDRQTEWVLDKDAPAVCTDPLAFEAPGAPTNAVLSVYERVPAPPTATVSAAWNKESNLASSTTYSYKVTCFDHYESGPGATYTATTTAQGQAFALNIRPPGGNALANGNTPCTQYEIYRSSSSDGSFNSIGTVPANLTGSTPFYDTGLTPASHGPPAPARLYYNAHILNGSNYATGVLPYNQVLEPVSSSYSGWTRSTVFLPAIILSDDTSNRGWCGIGTSRLSEGDIGGYGQYIAQFPNTDLFYGFSWFTRGMISAGRNSLNLGVPGGRLDWMNTNHGRNAFRRFALQFCHGIVSEFGINDVDNSVTWQNLAINKMQEAFGYRRKGVPYVATTLEPVTTDSVDNFMTTANQKPIGAAAARISYNDWVRSPCVADQNLNSSTGKVTLGTPIAPVSNTCPAGSSMTPLISKYFDAAATAECDYDGRQTLDGGYWCPPSGSGLTGTVIGTPSTTKVQIKGTALTVNQFSGYNLVMTSGPATGQMAIIFTNDKDGTLSLFANGVSWPGGGKPLRGFSTAPAPGDKFHLYRILTTDGLHGTTGWNREIAGPAFAAWLSAKFPVGY